MLGWMLNLTYLMIAVAATPWLIYRRVVQKKRIAGPWMKLSGRIARQHPARPCVWFHAVSVGEVLQLQTLVAEFAARHPQHEVLITTTTGTGFDVARQKFPQHTVTYWPFDFTWAVNRALRTVQPDLVVLVELELWPNFLRVARRRQIPVVVVNGRITVRSARGYARLQPLVRNMLRSLRHLAVQSPEYAERFHQLGAPSEQMTITGNLKYDRVESNRRNPKTEALRQAFGLQPNDLVFIAGSTQDPEEDYALQTWEALRSDFPQLRLILVPRHKERFEDVAKLVASRGHSLLRRSGVESRGVVESRESRVKSQDGPTDGHRWASSFPDPRPSTLNPQPILLDTLGELAACWGLADIAFVGGSLTQRGGQNMLEPAAYGAAVLFGPNTWNFREIVEELLHRDAACVVHSREELTATVRQLIEHPDQRDRMGRAAREFVLSQHGATEQTLRMLDDVLTGMAARDALRSAA